MRTLLVQWRYLFNYGKPFIQDSGKQGGALAVPSGPGQLENLSYFTETSCWAPWLLQVQSPWGSVKFS